MTTQIGCAGSCGKSVTPEDLKTAGWDYLYITGRYRCGECKRILDAASFTPGTFVGSNVDPLPPTSRGALKELPQRPPLREGVKP